MKPGLALPRIERSVRTKYRIVGALLSGEKGTILDLGARDAVLRTYLHDLEYSSADAGPGCDHRIDLEDVLPFSDRAFDVVVALDVLEHIESIHRAFDELARIAARRLVVALPHMASWRHRVAFLMTGRLGTGKYDLEPQAPSDRHRWLTLLGETDRFVSVRGARAGFRLVRVVREMEGGRLARVVARMATLIAPVDVWTTTRSIYLLERVEGGA